LATKEGNNEIKIKSNERKERVEEKRETERQMKTSAKLDSGMKLE
jgi:hypothetical protein